MIKTPSKKTIVLIPETPLQDILNMKKNPRLVEESCFYGSSKASSKSSNPIPIVDTVNQTSRYFNTLDSKRKRSVSPDVEILEFRTFKQTISDTGVDTKDKTPFGDGKSDTVSDGKKDEEYRIVKKKTILRDIPDVDTVIDQKDTPDGKRASTIDDKVGAPTRPLVTGTTKIGDDDDICIIGETRLRTNTDQQSIPELDDITMYSRPSYISNPTTTIFEF